MSHRARGSRPGTPADNQVGPEASAFDVTGVAAESIVGCPVVFGSADMDEVSLLREVVHHSTGCTVVIDTERLTLLLDRLT